MLSCKRLVLRSIAADKLENSDVFMVVLLWRAVDYPPSETSLIRLQQSIRPGTSAPIPAAGSKSIVF